MAPTSSSIFDDKFLINFTLPLHAYTVAEMMLVDSLLVQPVYNENNGCEYQSQMDESGSPETARFQDDDDCDHLSIRYQHLRSRSICEDYCRSAEKIHSSDVALNALSPIVNDGIDMTQFGNDQSCGLGCTFDLFESPNWLKNSEKCREGKSSDTADPNLSLPSINEEEFCESNIFARLSINPGEPQFDSISPFNDCGADKVSETKLKLQRRRKKMKQTTVTFFYDSDEEIKEDFDCNSDCDSAEIAYKADNQNKFRTNFRVRNALGLRKKNIQSSSLSGFDSVDGATSSLVNSATLSTVGGRGVNISMANLALLNWIKTSELQSLKQKVVLCSLKSRKAALDTIIEALVCQKADICARSKTHTKKGSKKILKTGHKPPGTRSRRESSLISSDAVLIVTQRDQVEVWAGIIRDLSETRLFLYTDTLAKRRKTGAHNLAQYDVVITSFDVLRAKEVCVPEDHGDSSSESDIHSDSDLEKDLSNKRFQDRKKGEERGREGGRFTDRDSGIGSDCDSCIEDEYPGGRLNTVNQKERVDGKEKEKEKEDIPWMKNRKNRNGVLLELSNTHLIEWRNVILDFHTATNIRIDTARGVAAKGLCGVSTMGVVTTALGDGEEERGRVKGVDRIERGSLDETDRGIDGGTDRGVGVGTDRGNTGRARSNSTVTDITAASGVSAIEGDKNPPVGWNSDSDSDSGARNMPCELKLKSTARTVRTDSNQAVEKNKKGKMKFGDIRSVCENVCAVLDVPPGVRDKDITFTLRAN